MRLRTSDIRQAALVAYRAASDLAAKGALLVITVAAARRLPHHAFGVFSLASTFGWILAVAADFGIQMHVARRVALEPGSAAATLRRWLRVRLATAAAALLVVAVAATAVPPEDALPLALFSLVYVASSVVEFLHYFYRGLSRSDVESSLTLWQRGATLVCALAALAWRPALVPLGIAMAVPVVATLIFSLRYARRLGDRVAIAVAVAPAASDRFGRDVFPIGAGIVLSALYFRIDVFLVQLWSGTEAVALYNAAFRLVEGLRLFPAAGLAVALPALCRAVDLQPLRRVAVLVTLVGAVGGAAAWIASGWALPFAYGESYRAAVPAFRILVLAFPLMSLNYALTHQVIGWNGERAYAVVCATALAGNVALNAVLIPRLSIGGAAWATVWTELIVTGGCVIALSARAARARIEQAPAVVTA